MFDLSGCGGIVVVQDPLYVPFLDPDCDMGELLTPWFLGVVVPVAAVCTNLMRNGEFIQFRGVCVGAIRVVDEVAGVVGVWG